MENVVDRILSLQERDIRIQRLQRELHDIPERKAEIQSRLDGHHKAIDAARETLKTRQAEVRQIEVEIESRRDKLRKLREQQMQLKTNKEFKAMEHELEVFQREIRALEDQALERMETIEGANQEVRRHEAELKKESAHVETDMSALDTRARELEAELAGVTQERATLAADVDPEWLRVYDRIFRNRKDRALVTVENGVCGGCHLTLPPYLCHEARRRNSIVMCEFCGRMLC